MGASWCRKINCCCATLPAARPLFPLPAVIRSPSNPQSSRPLVSWLRLRGCGHGLVNWHEWGSPRSFRGTFFLVPGNAEPWTGAAFCRSTGVSTGWQLGASVGVARGSSGASSCCWSGCGRSSCCSWFFGASPFAVPLSGVGEPLGFLFRLICVGTVVGELAYFCGGFWVNVSYAVTSFFFEVVRG